MIALGLGHEEEFPDDLAGLGVEREHVPFSAFGVAAGVADEDESTTSTISAAPRRRLVEEGIAAALTRKYNPNSARPRIFDGAAEAKLIALTCSPAPEGFARRSVRLLEEKVVELNIVGRPATTRSVDSKKTVLKPRRNRQWVIPPDANAGFVAAMEDVLETYQRPRDPDRPLVCLDEAPSS